MMTNTHLMHTHARLQQHGMQTMISLLTLTYALLSHLLNNTTLHIATQFKVLLIQNLVVVEWLCICTHQ
jgi:hypothetical protein